MTNTISQALIGCLRLRAVGLALALAVPVSAVIASRPVQAQTYSVLHTFAGYPSDGANPYMENASLIRDPEGNLYGTTEYGGAFQNGTVFRLRPKGREVLYSFTGGADGGIPLAGLVRDTAGNIYGTNLSGGSGGGVVFKLNKTGELTVLYNFVGGTAGYYPHGSLVLDEAGNLYGATYTGGDLSGCQGFGCGLVYKLDPDGNETVLYSFTGGVDGNGPNGSLLRDAAGNLYGTTQYGGNNSCLGGCGVIFRVAPNNKETVLYSFTGPDGANPLAGVIRDNARNLYGTTEFGGKSNGGTVFKLDPSGKETVLHTFTGGSDGGAVGLAGVILDRKGNLYSTAQDGGGGGCFFGCGVVFMLDPTGKETVLHSFTGGADGSGPIAGLVGDTAGNGYGLTQFGGTTGYGVVFKLTP